ncbi:MAG TPA: Trm112 family protein [Micromonosporaceae bacterium]
MDAELLEILACPDTHHAPLSYEAGAQTLTCTECGRIFPIRDGIPVLLLDEATPPTGGAAGADGGTG